MTQEIVTIDALALEAFEAGTVFAAETASIGEPLGLRALGARLHVVQPGKSACPFHRHHGADELFLILSGMAVSVFIACAISRGSRGRPARWMVR